MYLSIGGVLRPFNEARAAISYEIVYDGMNRAALVKSLWGISGRVIQQSNATQAGMTIKLRQLASDIQKPRPDLIFYEDDGATQTALKLLAADCVDGPNLTDLSFPDKAPDIYPTGVEYGCTFQATNLALNASSNPITEFTEIITPGGGGQEVILVGGAINPAEYQTAKQNAPWYYTQSGSAVGMFGYPPVPPPLWPDCLLKTMQPVRESPRVAGPIGMYYRISWSYDFGSPWQLFGLPHTFTY